MVVVGREVVGWGGRGGGVETEGLGGVVVWWVGGRGSERGGG